MSRDKRQAHPGDPHRWDGRLHYLVVIDDLGDPLAVQFCLDGQQVGDRLDGSGGFGLGQHSPGVRHRLVSVDEEALRRDPLDGGSIARRGYLQDAASQLGVCVPSRRQPVGLGVSGAQELYREKLRISGAGDQDAASLSNGAIPGYDDPLY